MRSFFLKTLISVRSPKKLRNVICKTPHNKSLVSHFSQSAFRSKQHQTLSHVQVLEEKKIFLTTCSSFDGMTITKHLDMVTGYSVQARTFFHDMFSRFIGFFGGEVPSYAELVNRCTRDAVRSLMTAAHESNADGIVGIKFQMSSTSDPTAGVFCYVLAYGTAVKLSINPQQQQQQNSSHEQEQENLTHGVTMAGESTENKAQN